MQFLHKKVKTIRNTVGGERINVEIRLPSLYPVAKRYDLWMETKKSPPVLARGLEKEEVKDEIGSC